MKDGVNHDKLKVFAQEEYANYSSLPMIVYVVADDGTIIEANNSAKELFEWNQDEIDAGKVSIVPHYLIPKDRDRVLQIFSDTEDGSWVKNQTLVFKTNERETSLRFFARPYFGEQKLRLGAICIMFEITEIERFRDMQEIIPASIFEMRGEDGSVSYANKKFRKQFEYNQENSGLDKLRIFSKDEERESFIDEIKENESVKNRKAIFKRYNHTHFIGSVNAMAEIDTDGSIVKIKGTIEDVTYNNISGDAPIGLYYVNIDENGEDVVLCANKHFAEIIGVDNPTDCEGIIMRTLHLSGEHYKEFKLKLDEADKSNLILKNCQLRIKNKKADIKELIVNAKNIRDKQTGKVTGRVGTIYDVTDDITLNKFSEWEQDFAAFLHNYAAMSVSLRDSFNAIINEQPRKYFISEKLKMDDVISKLQGAVSSCKTLLTKNVKTAEEKGFIDEELKKSIDELIKGYDIYKIDDKENATKASLAAGLRHHTVALRNYVEDNKVLEKLPNETVRELKNSMNEVLRFARLLTMDGAVLELNDMLDEIDNFKEALMIGHGGNTTFDKSHKFNIVAEIENAINYLGEFAKKRTAQIKFSKPPHSLLCRGNQRYMYNAMYNVVHNAIKYTWKRADGKLSFIDIRLKEELNHVILTVENRGVPISKEEIEHDLIFKFGHRGRKSSDRNRSGSGIGLWFTRKMLKQYGGDIKITSEPLSYNRPDDYTKLFITTVTITLLKTI